MTIYRFASPRQSHKYDFERPNLTVAEWAYIAGFLDGEGHIKAHISDRRAA